jgi:hypothetical protein
VPSVELVLRSGVLGLKASRIRTPVVPILDQNRNTTCSMAGPVHSYRKKGAKLSDEQTSELPPTADDRVDSDPAEELDLPTLQEVLMTLPLFDELYLRMQVMNLAIIDGFIIEREEDLLREYIDPERTPVPSAIFVSALSQQWLFALYEVLRTWRQRANDILHWNREWAATPEDQREARLEGQKAKIEKRMADPRFGTALYWEPYEKAALDPEYAPSLRRALDRMHSRFKRLEALRVTLAKHEVPGSKGTYALAPGYGRINMLTGSMSFTIALGDNETDIVSRREIAESFKELGLPETVQRILPEPIQEMLMPLRGVGYGTKRVVVTLKDGTEIGGVYVLWCKEVVFVERHQVIPFDADDVSDVRLDTSRLPDMEEAADDRDGELPDRS